MKFILSILTLCLVFSGNVRAQYVEIGTAIGVLEDLKVYNAELFVGGDFINFNGSPCYFSASYDGTTFTPQLDQTDGTGIKRFGIYDFDLYATGFVDGEGLTEWNGTTWNSNEGFTDSHTGILGNGQELYIGSDVGNTSLSISGAAFTTLPPLGQIIYAIDTFAGSIYVGGDFTSSLAGPVNRIARWDGTDWQPLTQGLTGGFGGGSVLCLASYKGELYVGGIFTVAGSVLTNGIARWNGSSWSDVGGGLASGNTNGVRDMVVFNNELYVVGDFNEIGGVTTKYVAKWDGSNWTGLSLDASTDFANCVEVYNGSLYVATNNPTASKLYQLDLMVGVDEAAAGLMPLQVVQDRETDEVTVSWDREMYAREARVQVVDLQGRTVFSGSTRRAEIAFSAGGWGAGMYIVWVMDSETVLGRAKFLQY